VTVTNVQVPKYR